MTSERFLVTGALGAVGAWVCAALAEDDVEVVGLDSSKDRRRLELATAHDVPIVHGSVTDRSLIETTVDSHRITHIVHLAALLIPQIKADPPGATDVNVGGTVNVLDVAKGRNVRVAYASSAAVYSRADGQSDGSIPDDAFGRPESFYGVHKQACEGLARIFWEAEGVPSVALRPYVVYGPGRDSGLTAAPTLAMAAAARGESFAIPFGGRVQLQFALDVAQLFVAAARALEVGAHVFHLGGPATDLTECAAEIERAVPGVTIDVAADAELPFPPEFDGTGLEQFVGGFAWTPLADGIRFTIDRMRSTSHSSV